MRSWLAMADMNAIKTMVDELAGMVRSDDLRLYLKKDKFSQVVEAVADASSAIADESVVFRLRISIIGVVCHTLENARVCAWSECGNCAKEWGGCVLVLRESDIALGETAQFQN